MIYQYQFTVFCSIQEWFSHRSHLYWNGSNSIFWSGGLICNRVISSSTKKGKLSGGYLTKVKIPLLLIDFMNSCHWMQCYCKPYCFHADGEFLFLFLRNRDKEKTIIAFSYNLALVFEFPSCLCKPAPLGSCHISKWLLLCSSVLLRTINICIVHASIFQKVASILKCLNFLYTCRHAAIEKLFILQSLITTIFDISSLF